MGKRTMDTRVSEKYGKIETVLEGVKTEKIIGGYDEGNIFVGSNVVKSLENRDSTKEVLKIG